MALGCALLAGEGSRWARLAIASAGQEGPPRIVSEAFGSFVFVRVGGSLIPQASGYELADCRLHSRPRRGVISFCSRPVDSLLRCVLMVMHIYIYIHTYIYVYTYIDTYTGVYVYIYIYIYIYIYMDRFAYTYTYNTYVYM